MSSDLHRWELAVIDEANEVLSRHVQQVGGLLCGEKVIFWHERHGPPFREHLRGLLYDIGQGCRNGSLPPVVDAKLEMRSAS